MQSAKAYLELVRERGKRGLPLERVYRQVFNTDLYLSAYGRIYRNAGAMTKGVTDETPDGMSLEKIGTIIEAVRYERYQWKPTRRTYILKKNGEKRPLGLPVWSDKVVQEVIRQILEAYFEPTFSHSSHGFRPGRGCHTALREIYHHWVGTVWYIDGDISDCFGSLNHELLLKILSAHIQDKRFLTLMRAMPFKYLNFGQISGTMLTIECRAAFKALARLTLQELGQYWLSNCSLRLSHSSMLPLIWTKIGYLNGIAH